MLPSILGENLFDEMFDDAFEMMPSFNRRNPLYGKHGKNQVEIRKYIFMYDLSCCFRRRFHRTVCPPVKPVFLNLLAGKPCSVIWIISGRLNPPGPLRLRSLLFFS